MAAGMEGKLENPVDKCEPRSPFFDNGEDQAILLPPSTSSTLDDRGGLVQLPFPLQCFFLPPPPPLNILSILPSPPRSMILLPPLCAADRGRIHTCRRRAKVPISYSSYVCVPTHTTFASALEERGGRREGMPLTGLSQYLHLYVPSTELFSLGAYGTHVWQTFFSHLAALAA